MDTATDLTPGALALDTRPSDPLRPRGKSEAGDDKNGESWHEDWVQAPIPPGMAEITLRR